MAWEKAIEHGETIYKLTASRSFSADNGLVDQIRRAVVSISSNIAEGFERGSNRSFIQYLYFARGSAAEVKSQLYLANKLGYINKQDLENIIEENSEIAKMLNGLISYLKKKID